MSKLNRKEKNRIHEDATISCYSWFRFSIPKENEFHNLKKIMKVKMFIHIKNTIMSNALSYAIFLCDPLSYHR